MSEDGQRNGLRLAWGDKVLAARGPVAAILLMWITLVGAILYAGYRQEQVVVAGTASIGNQLRDGREEHRALTHSNAQTACVVTMSPADRERFRLEFRPGAWSRWCPWIQE